LYKKTLAILSSLLFAFDVSAIDAIGSVVEHQGFGAVTRESEVLDSSLGFDISPMDHVETFQGRMKLEFTETSELYLVENTEATITKYYYDKDKNDGELAIKFVSGTARFTTGRLGLIPKENIQVQTPTATIAIRGTDFTTSVDELGRSLVILLPETECTIDGDCSPSGEITVTNEGGTVSLTEAYQATMVSSMDQTPTQPVVLENINLSMIDNMFIVSPPKEINEVVDEEQSKDGNSTMSILDFTELDADYLAEDYLAEDDLEFTELDIDFLNVDFLQDLLITLDQVDALATRSADGIEGTKLGFDKDTQFNTIIDKGMGQIWFYRNVNGVVSIKVPVGSNMKLETDNEGRRNNILVGDGTSVVIIIKQSG
jgi:hypothetical protein